MADHKDSKNNTDDVKFETTLTGKPMRPDDPVLNPAHDSNRLCRNFVTFPGCYPNLGLFQSFAETTRVFPDIAYWEKKLQADYRDAPGQRYALNPVFIEKQKELWRKYVVNFRIEDMNTCSVGNLAFVSLMNPTDKELNEAYEFVVDKIKKFYPLPNATK